MPIGWCFYNVLQSKLAIGWLVAWRKEAALMDLMTNSDRIIFNPPAL
jgi:hypothetical protein